MMAFAIPERGRHHDRAQDIWKYVAKYDLGDVSHTDAVCGEDKLVLLDAQNIASHDSGSMHPTGHTNHEHNQ